MQADFDVTITEQDLYKYQLRSAYTGTQGWTSILVGLAAIAMCINTLVTKNASAAYALLYGAFGVVILVYVPVALYLQSKRQYKANTVFSGTMHYSLGENGIGLAAGEENATLPWNAVYKVKAAKDYLYIHTGRKNAYIIPMYCIEGKRNDIRTVLEANLEDYRLSIKKL